MENITIPEDLQGDFNRIFPGTENFEITSEIVRKSLEVALDDPVETKISKINLTAFFQNKIQNKPFAWKFHNILIRTILAGNDPRMDQVEADGMKNSNHYLLNIMILLEPEFIPEKSYEKFYQHQKELIRSVEEKLLRSNPNPHASPHSYPKECATVLREDIKSILLSWNTEFTPKGDKKACESAVEKLSKKLEAEGLYDMAWYRMRPNELLEDLKSKLKLAPDMQLCISLIWTYMHIGGNNSPSRAKDAKNLIEKYQEIKCMPEKSEATQEILQIVENYFNKKNKEILDHLYLKGVDAQKNKLISDLTDHKIYEPNLWESINEHNFAETLMGLPISHEIKLRMLVIYASWSTHLSDKMEKLVKETSTSTLSPENHNQKTQELQQELKNLYRYHTSWAWRTWFKISWFIEFLWKKISEFCMGSKIPDPKSTEAKAPAPLNEVSPDPNKSTEARAPAPLNEESDKDNVHEKYPNLNPID